MRMMSWVMAVVALGGCRAATRIVQESRMDLDLSQGNRGYLLGTPPPASEDRATTRQMVETEIEVPSLRRAPKAGAGMKPVGLEEVAPPEIDLGESWDTPGSSGDSGAHDTYVVKKGDTLWSIAAQSRIYGDATKWRRLYEANRDLLKSPDRIRAGMQLRIPRGESESQTFSDTTSAYTK